MTNEDFVSRIVKIFLRYLIKSFITNKAFVLTQGLRQNTKLEVREGEKTQIGGTQSTLSNVEKYVHPMPHPK